MEIVPSQKYIDKRLGLIHVRTLSTATHFTARWKDDGLHITIPSHTSAEEYDRILEGWIPKLLEMKPAPKNAKFYPGYKFATDDWSFEIVCNNPVGDLYVRPSFTGFSKENPEQRCFKISVSPSFDFNIIEHEKAIEKAILNTAGYVAQQVLIPQAKEEAKRLGLDNHVKTWEIGRGIKRLGCCYSKGRISLSSTLMFLPRQLRLGTITHELAHLSHFDHSPAFYALWDKYLGAPHEEIKAAVKSILDKAPVT